MLNSLERGVHYSCFKLVLIFFPVCNDVFCGTRINRSLGDSGRNFHQQAGVEGSRYDIVGAEFEVSALVGTGNFLGDWFASKLSESQCRRHLHGVVDVF